VIVFHVAITTHPDYLAKREPHRPARLDLEIVQRKWIARTKILEKAHISPHYHERVLEPSQRTLP